MKNDPIPVDVALISLYNNTRKASLPLEEHDANRAYVDVLAQALNINCNGLFQLKHKSKKILRRNLLKPLNK